MNNNYWVLNGSGSLPNTEISYDTTPRIDHKRNHQWFMDTAEHELLFKKKQAIESVKETSSVMDNLFIPKPVRSLNNSNKNVSDLVNMEKKGYENQFGNDSSICLTMSNAVENPLCMNTGIGFMEPTFHRTGNNIFPGPTCNTARDANTITMGPDFSKMDKNFISVGQGSSKRDNNFMLQNQYFNGMDSNMLTTGQAFNKGNYNINEVGYEKQNGNFMSIGPTYDKGHENFFPFYSKSNETFINAASTYNKDNASVLPMVENYTKGQQTTIYFGGFKDNNHEIMLNQSSGKDSEEQPSENVVSATTSMADGAQKAKDPKTKKGPSNNFPSNVKSLLSTGILDGVPVKYVSWSREKNLRGVVNGTGYLCSCQDCKLNKVINAYEFERHAGCKTKHPNNHIYFENGKTIYAVVQELKSTPQEILFEVIPNVTGSPVNQKNFQTWKASFKAATLELQRIYGQDEVIVQS